MLFLATVFLGFRRYHEKLIEYCGKDPEVDAVHIALETPLWQSILGKSVPLPNGWDFHSYRHLLMWRFVLNHWFRSSLPLERFDVVHIITQGVAWSVVDKPVRCQTRFAVNLDCTAVNDVEELGVDEWCRRPVRRAEEQIFRSADLVVCRNRWTSRSVIEDYAIPAEKVCVARNSMWVPAASRQDRPPRGAGELVRLVFVGNDFDRKGGPELVRLHQARFADKAELHVCSARAVPDRSLTNIVWHGAVPNARVIEEILPDMDVFVMPTRNDMHPWAVLEAASVGLPVISSRLAGIPEMVIDGKSGLLCPVGDWTAVGDAIASLIEDTDRRWRMGAAARAHITDNYSPDREFGGLLARLKSLGHQDR